MTEAGNSPLELLQTFSDQVWNEQGQPGDIATGLRKAGDQPVRHRIGSSSEDDWEGSRRLLGGQRGGCTARSDDEINRARDQLGCKSGESLQLSLGISILEHHVATLEVAEVTESLTESFVQVGGRSQAGCQVAQSSDPRARLPLGGERPADEAASQGP